MHALAARVALIGLIALRQIGLGPHVDPRPTDPQSQLVELWQAPADIAQRDLFGGPVFPIDAPKSGATFTFESQKTTGFSPGYDVVDSSGREWSVKLGVEAQPEVVASRLLWAIGYHQPPVYYVDHWNLQGGPQSGPQAAARFRPKGKMLESEGPWMWQRNPFVDTAPYRGLIVMMLLLNSTDLRNDNNEIYDVHVAGSDTRQRWYVVKDLGATFGESGVYRPQRNDVDAFEREPLVTYDDKGQANFAYRGLQKELLPLVSAADVKWTSDLLDALTPDQWRDAFRAGGYSDDVASRYITALQQRLAVARKLDDSFSGEGSDYWANRFIRATADRLREIPAHLP
jgi:hypothetical protein